MGKVISIEEKAPEQALEQLQRLTGLDFSQYPESLLSAPVSNGNADSIRLQAMHPAPDCPAPASAQTASADPLLRKA